MTNTANATAALEYTIRMTIGGDVQNAAADMGYTVSEWSTMYDVVVAELAAYGANWTR